MKKNDEILKRFQFDLELGVFKKYDSNLPKSYIFYLNEDDEKYSTKYYILVDALINLGYRCLKRICRGTIQNETITTIHVGCYERKTFYTTDDDVFFMLTSDVLNDIPDYLMEYCIVKNPGRDLFGEYY